MSGLDSARICKARARKEFEKRDDEWDRKSGRALWWWRLDIVFNVKKSITATCYEVDKPCYLDTCLYVIAVRGTLTLPSISFTRLLAGESWPLHRAKADCLFCSGSGTAQESGKAVVSLKNSSVSAAFKFFKVVSFYVNVFSWLWFLVVTTIFSKGWKSVWEVQTPDESLNFKLKMRGFWWCWCFLCFPA